MIASESRELLQLLQPLMAILPPSFLALAGHVCKIDDCSSHHGCSNLTCAALRPAATLIDRAPGHMPSAPVWTGITRCCMLRSLAGCCPLPTCAASAAGSLPGAAAAVGACSLAGAAALLEGEGLMHRTNPLTGGEGVRVDVALWYPALLRRGEAVTASRDAMQDGYPLLAFWQSHLWAVPGV